MDNLETQESEQTSVRKQAVKNLEIPDNNGGQPIFVSNKPKAQASRKEKERELEEAMARQHAANLSIGRVNYTNFKKEMQK